MTISNLISVCEVNRSYKCNIHKFLLFIIHLIKPTKFVTVGTQVDKLVETTLCAVTSPVRSLFAKLHNNTQLDLSCDWEKVITFIYCSKVSMCHGPF